MSKEKQTQIQNEVDIRQLIMDIIDNINYINRTSVNIKSIMNILEHEHHISLQQIADRIATESSISTEFILDVINEEEKL